MNGALRKTGIGIIGECSWGTHICLLYQTKADLFEILVPYFKAGLEKNESCIWIVPAPLDKGKFVQEIRRAMPKLNHYLKKGQIEILRDTQWYLKEGEFNWVTRLNLALTKSYKGLRIAGGMYWRKNNWGKIIDYEEEIKNIIARHQMTAICTYPIDKLGSKEIIDLAVNHQFILIKKNAKWELIESTRLKGIEESVLRSKDQLRLITSTLPVFIFYVDSKQYCRFANRAPEDWNGISSEEFCGLPVKKILGESAYKAIHGHIEAALSGQQTCFAGWIPYERGGSGLHYISAVHIPDCDEGGKVKGFFVMVTDNTERRKLEEQLTKYREHLEELVGERTVKFKIANEQIQHEIIKRKSADQKIRVYQEQLRSLASELALLEERERRRIAVDLHDNIGQILAISKIKLGGVRELVSPSFAKQLDEIHEFIEQTIQYTRSLTFELSPPILYEVGFEAAVEWLAERIQELHNISVKFEDDKQPKPLEEEIRFLLFKAVRELLINVVKHAGANKIEVAIQREDGKVRITVEDNGVGFYISEARRVDEMRGFGLFSIREWLRHFGGSVQIQSEPGHGTRVTLLAPLKQIEK